MGAIGLVTAEKEIVASSETVGFESTKFVLEFDDDEEEGKYDCLHI